MKKRIRKTGEVVDVVTYSTPCGAIRNECDSVSYVDSQGNEHDRELGLNILWDFEDVEEVLSTDIDWEQLRIKAAVSTLQGFASNPNSTSVTDEELALWSVRAADYLIAELKKGGKQ